MPLAPIAILACGNPSRGDDALGPVLLARLQEWLHAEGRADEFDLIGDFQLQVEHALDLVGRRLALFIDAGQQTPAPFVFRCARATAVATHSTHALSPEAVLAVLPQIGERRTPPAFMLCVRGESFVLGEAMSAAATRNADVAFALLQALCGDANEAVWSARTMTV
ncbi:MAG TPA: hydrogenase maturation protease [Accumulibacter sp.]|jgi:hydrogenase maturation protease|nr:hydrogenase maturation protease [Accumulibacter sp.]HQC79139.1 hydrogenase maturation protease [Accumulibacter sp.]